jgi:hypothetical protein
LEIFFITDKCCEGVGSPSAIRAALRRSADLRGLSQTSAEVCGFSQIFADCRGLSRESADRVNRFEPIRKLQRIRGPWPRLAKVREGLRSFTEDCVASRSSARGLLWVVCWRALASISQPFRHCFCKRIVPFSCFSALRRSEANEAQSAFETATKGRVMPTSAR